MDKVYHVYRVIRAHDGISATVDGLPLIDAEPAPQKPRCVTGARDLRLCSLAFAMLAYEIGEIAAEERYQEFKRFIAARLQVEPGRDEWTLSGAEIQRWWQARSRPAMRLVRRTTMKG